MQHASANLIYLKGFFCTFGEQVNVFYWDVAILLVLCLDEEKVWINFSFFIFRFVSEDNIVKFFCFFQLSCNAELTLMLFFFFFLGLCSLKKVDQKVELQLEKIKSFIFEIRNFQTELTIAFQLQPIAHKAPFKIPYLSFFNKSPSKTTNTCQH